MRSSIRLFSIYGIDINIHVTFLFLLAFVMPGGMRSVFLVVAIFFFVTVHELCHSVVAKRFGIPVREITLFPIGGVSAMGRMPERPAHELLISLAGPASNLAAMAILYFPAKYILGAQNLFHPLSTSTWPLAFAYAYWINLILAVFNMLPAFPMDGGRVLRALLALVIGYGKATKISVGLGHLFAFIFAYFGIIRFNMILVVIAVFIYMAASSEGLQVDIKESLKKFKVRDILPRDFVTINKSTSLSQVLEFIFHSHQEDFPVADGKDIVGFVTRQDIMSGLHSLGPGTKVGDIMRTDFPVIKDTDSLARAQDVMNEKSARAMPVMRDGHVAGIITLEDIGRAYAVISQKS